MHLKISPARWHPFSPSVTLTSFTKNEIKYFDQTIFLYKRLQREPFVKELYNEQ